MQEQHNCLAWMLRISLRSIRALASIPSTMTWGMMEAIEYRQLDS